MGEIVDMMLDGILFIDSGEFTGSVRGYGYPVYHNNNTRRGRVNMNKISNVALKVVGVTFANDDGTNRQQIIGAMTKDAPVMLKREPHNLHDTNAIAVSSIDGQVGYIGKDYAKILAPLMDAGARFKARVSEVSTYKNTNYLHIIVDEE